MSKYNSVISYVDGKKFHSLKEARRYSELLLAVRGGVIKDLQTQVKYSLDINDVHICNYIADMVYQVVETNEMIVEYVKGYKKGSAYAMFSVKKKLMLACHGIEILET
jgi:hypothetical protein